MYIRKFTYSAEDVNCRNCTEYAAKLGCRHEVCPFLTERIEAGVVSYQSAVKAMIPRRSILWNRLSALIQNYPDYLWADSNHKTRMELFNHQLGYNKSRNTPSYYAAMYLLTSNQGLFNRTGNCFYRSGIEFGYATLNGISAHDTRMVEDLFDRQYILTEFVETETRYRTETRTDYEYVYNPDTGSYEWRSYTHTVQVPYEYRICTVTLENRDLSHLPVELLSGSQLNMYATYMATLGNRPELFPDSPYVDLYLNKTDQSFDIPADAIPSDQVAAMLREAQKYLGYPYVWGGSSPETSFDCSGYVCWVVNHSGWNIGRLSAQGICNVCIPISAANAQPGDLVFFKGTYDTPGVSHCGIYVGNNTMIHCGDPIKYANLNTNYWQSHFYCFGRLP